MAVQLGPQVEGLNLSATVGRVRENIRRQTNSLMASYKHWFAIYVRTML